MPPSAMYHVLFSRLCNLTVSPCFRSSAKATSRSGINGAMTSARTLSTNTSLAEDENQHCAKLHTGLQWPGVHDEPFWCGSDEVKRVTGYQREFPAGSGLHNLCVFRIDNFRGADNVFVGSA